MPLRSVSPATRALALAIVTGLALPAHASQPEPAEPQPVEPQPVEPQPVEPQPTQPEPVEPQPVASDTWDDEPAATSSTPERMQPAAPVQPVPTYAVPAPTSAPDPLLLERNRKLSEKMQYGERRLIAGRIAAGIGITFVAVGGIMFAFASLRGPLENDEPNRLWAGGGVLMGLGVAGLVAGAVLWVRGSRIVKEANRGELSFRVRPGAHGLHF